MDFALFIIVTGLIFIRPGEFNPALIYVPLYEGSIIACFLASFPSILAQSSSSSLTRRPINVCVIGMLAAVVLADLVHVAIPAATDHGFMLAKILVYYLLLVGVVNTPARLRRFLIWLAFFGTAISGMGLLTYHGIVKLQYFTPLTDVADDGETLILRLRGGSTSVLADPNDLCLVIVACAILCLHGLTDRRAGPLRRIVWLAPLGVLGFAFVLTRSRGGFLSLLAGLLVLFSSRFGWRRAVLLMGLGVPVMLGLGGRQTDISTSGGSGQGRIQIWFEALILFFHSPVFGGGIGHLEEQIGRAAHNSYLQCYAELGFFGGTIFLGAFFCAIASLRRLGPGGTPVPDPEMRRLRPFLLAVVVAWSTGMMTLSVSYILPTYLVLGLAAAFAGVAPANAAEPPLRLDAQLVRRVVVLSVAFVAVLEVYVRSSARWR